MAKKLGMNPKKLPGLTPAKSQPWKAPVRIFIEECYERRFKNKPARRRKPAQGAVTVNKGASREALDEDVGAEPYTESGAARGGRPHDAAGGRRWDIATDLVCHFANLQGELEQELVAGCVEPESLARIVADLRRVANEIETGQSVCPMPYNDFELGRADGNGVPF